MIREKKKVVKKTKAKEPKKPSPQSNKLDVYETRIFAIKEVKKTIEMASKQLENGSLTNHEQGYWAKILGDLSGVLGNLLKQMEAEKLEVSVQGAQIEFVIRHETEETKGRVENTPVTNRGPQVPVTI